MSLADYDDSDLDPDFSDPDQENNDILGVALASVIQNDEDYVVHIDTLVQDTLPPDPEDTDQIRFGIVEAPDDNQLIARNSIECSFTLDTEVVDLINSMVNTVLEEVTPPC